MYVPKFYVGDIANKGCVCVRVCGGWGGVMGGSEVGIEFFKYSSLYYQHVDNSFFFK